MFLFVQHFKDWIYQVGKKFVFNKKNPFVFGVSVNAGKLRLGTPLIVPETKVVLGKVISIEKEQIRTVV